MIEIVELLPARSETKRFEIVLNINGENISYEFGAKDGSTYIDHGDEKKRTNYRRRHLANRTEAYRIHHLVPSPALFSYRLLWGDSTDLFDNLVDLQRDFNLRYK